jgi:tRNA pseudouridine38-40 synthase
MVEKEEVFLHKFFSMSRYFIELSYKGTRYSGFQSQHNANTIQSEVEKALQILRKEKIVLTGSSRTDTGVHAIRNYFHFDTLMPVDQREMVYKMNAILPGDIGILNIFPVNDDFVYREKNPFLQETAYYFPYRLDIGKMQEAAGLIKNYSDFTSFSKRNTQVKNFDCVIMESRWLTDGGCLIYHVKANRFLRGMVRALTATMLKIGRSKMDLAAFEQVITLRDCTKASFAVPARGLFLMGVEYLPGYLPAKTSPGP